MVASAAKTHAVFWLWKTVLLEMCRLRMSCLPEGYFGNG